MADQPILDPDLEEILHDIANDPRSKLFVTDPKRLLRGLQDGSLPRRELATGLLPAEQHLLQVYREELSFFYRASFLERFLREAPHNIVYVHNRADPNRIVEQALALPSLPFDAVEDRGETLVDEVPSAALTKSLCLVDTPQARTYLAHYYLSQGSTATALGVANSLLARPLGPQIHDAALQIRGLVSLANAQVNQALASYREALELGLGVLTPAESAIPAFNLLALSLVTGDRSAALRAAEALDSLETNGDLLRQNAEKIRMGHESKFRSSTTSELAYSLEQSIGQPSREFINALR